MYFDRKHWLAVVAEKSKLCVYQHSTFERKYLIKKDLIEENLLVTSSSISMTAVNCELNLHLDDYSEYDHYLTFSIFHIQRIR